MSSTPLTTLSYELSASTQPALGLITLQTDHTIEDDFRRLLFPFKLSLLHTRIPMQDAVNADTLQQMEHCFAQSLNVFPKHHSFDAIGYACTSASLIIGDVKLEELIRPHVMVKHITNPLLATLRALNHLNVKKIGFLAPYHGTIALQMMDYFQQHDIAIERAATFSATQDSVVSLINESSIEEAVKYLTQCRNIEAIFIACTALKCTPHLPRLTQQFGLPIISSNLTLAHDLLNLTHTQNNLL